MGYRCSRCDTVGRVDIFNTGGYGFESSQLQFIVSKAAEKISQDKWVLVKPIYKITIKSINS